MKLLMIGRARRPSVTSRQHSGRISPASNSARFYAPGAEVSMTAPVVTFSIQIGSDGYTIARTVAQRLGYRYYDWHITSAAASAAEGGAEESPSLVDRMMSRLM